MKRKVPCLVAVSLLLGLLTQTIASAESIEYCDLVHHLIVSWNQSVTRDELTAMYGEPAFDEETYLSFWDQEKSIQYSFYFDNGLLTNIYVVNVVSSRDQWSSVYTNYYDTVAKLSETLGERRSYRAYYNGDERAASDVDCIVGLWSGNGIIAQVIYNQAETKVYAETSITAVP